MKFFCFTLLLLILTGCVSNSSKSKHETSECLRFRSMMSSLLDHDAMYSLQEACINSKRSKQGSELTNFIIHYSF